MSNPIAVSKKRRKLTISQMKHLLLAVMGGILIIMGYYIWRYNQDTVHRVKPQPDQIPDADVSAQDVEVQYIVQDRILWHLKAKEAIVDNMVKETRLRTIQVDFFDEHGLPMMYVTSAQGVKNDVNGDIVAAGNVQATALARGFTLKSEELAYSAQTEQITSSQHVELSRDNLVIEGDEFESDLNFHAIKIRHNVRTTFAVAGQADSSGSITASTLHLDNEAQIATYTGNVVAQQGAAQFSADVMRVFLTRLQGTEDAIKQIDASGHVRITQADLVAGGAESQYISSTQRIRIGGTPEQQAYAENHTDRQRIQADRITIFLATNDVESEGRVRHSMLPPAH